VIVAIMAIAVLGIATLAVVGAGDDSNDPGASEEDQPAASDDDASDSADSGGSGDEPGGEVPTEAELSAVVEEISAFVEDERGLDFRQPVQVELEDDAGFEQRLLEDFDEEAEEMAQAEVLYKALGLLAPDETLMAVLEQAYSGGVVGFYDPETDELVVRGTALTPSIRVTIAHELTHALDDQHFDLDRTEYDDADDEIGFGFTALAEGQAIVIEQAYVESLSPEEQEEYFDEMMEGGGGLADVPSVIVDMIAAPYIYGPDLVDELASADGQEGVDAAYAEPPRTSEQVLDPEAYLEGEGAVEVPHPTPDGEVVEDGVLGQLMIELVLSQAVPPGDAEDAALGWGGDWFTTWEDGERACTRVTMVGDDADETDELRDAWDEWSEGVDLDVTVEQAAAGDPVTVTSCTSGPGGPVA
jgi:hypothetical protein